MTTSRLLRAPQPKLSSSPESSRSVNAARGLLRTRSTRLTKLGRAERNTVSQEKVTKAKPVMRCGEAGLSGSAQSIGARNWEDARADTFICWSGAWWRAAGSEGRVSGAQGEGGEGRSDNEQRDGEERRAESVRSLQAGAAVAATMSWAMRRSVLFRWSAMRPLHVKRSGACCMAGTQTASPRGGQKVGGPTGSSSGWRASAVMGRAALPPLTFAFGGEGGGGAAMSAGGTSAPTTTAPPEEYLAPRLSVGAGRSMRLSEIAPDPKTRMPAW